MKINNQSNCYNPNFQAQFWYTKDLEALVYWAIDHNKFQKLNQARKNIGSRFLQNRIKFELSKTPEGFPVVTFTSYSPRKSARLPKTLTDFSISKPIVYQSSKRMSMFNFGYQQLIKLGNDVPKNNMYQRVVIRGGD